MLPRTLEWDLIWKLGLCRRDQAKRRSSWIRVSPAPLAESLLRREKFGHRHSAEGHVYTQDTQRGTPVG